MKDILIRAGKTFIQGFFASLAISINGASNIDEKLIKSVLIGAVAGGISAVMNFIVKEITKEEE